MEVSPTAHLKPPFWWVRWVPVALLMAGLIALTIVIGGQCARAADWQAWQLFSPSRK